MRSQYMQFRASFIRGMRLALGSDDEEQVLVVLDYLADHGVDPSAIMLRMTSSLGAADVGHILTAAAMRGIKPVMATIDIERDTDDPYDDDAPFEILLDDPTWPVARLIEEGETIGGVGLPGYHGTDLNRVIASEGLKRLGMFFIGSAEHEWLHSKVGLQMTPQEALERYGFNVVVFVEMEPEPVREPGDVSVHSLRLLGMLYEPHRVPDLRRIGIGPH